RAGEQTLRGKSRSEALTSAAASAGPARDLRARADVALIAGRRHRRARGHPVSPRKEVASAIERMGDITPEAIAPAIALVVVGGLEMVRGWRPRLDLDDASLVRKPLSLRPVLRPRRSYGADRHRPR